jgi:hypothetical protein
MTRAQLPHQSDAEWARSVTGYGPERPDQNS